MGQRGKLFKGGASLMSVFGVPTVTFIIIFGWIPFWWLIAGISLYRMRRHDKQKNSRGVSDG